MGVLGWTYDQTLDTPMPAIKAALGARNKRDDTVLKIIGGFLGAKFETPETTATSARKLTPKLFDAIFAGLK